MNKTKRTSIEKIVLDEETNKKFLDFDNNQDMFCFGNKEEYFCEIYNYVRKLVYNSRNTKEMILNKSFIPNLIRILNDDILIANKAKEMCYLELLHYLITYHDTINIIRLNNGWPYYEEDPSVRNEAIELLEKQSKEIEEFIKEIDYDKKLKELLDDYKEYIDTKGKLPDEVFFDLDLIFTTSHNIPKEYTDLYIKNVTCYNMTPSMDAFRNAISSLISNYAKEHGTYCYTDICRLDMGTLGCYDNHVILISTSSLNYYFLNSSARKIDLFDTIFHELAHLMQENTYKSKYLPYEYILMLKDFLLTIGIEESYSRMNYMNLTTEIDARKNGYVKSDEYLLSMGIMPKTSIFRKTALDEKMHRSDYRYLDGKEYTVDTLLDEKMKEVIKEIEREYEIDIFKEYPVLNLMFHKDGKRKTTLEMLKMRESTTDKEIISQIDEILIRRKLSKENSLKDLEELIRDDTLSIDKTEYIRNLKLLLSLKDRKKLLVKLKSISLLLNEMSRCFLVFLAELEEIEASLDSKRVDAILQKKKNSKNEIDKSE